VELDPDPEVVFGVALEAFPMVRPDLSQPLPVRAPVLLRQGLGFGVWGLGLKIGGLGFRFSAGPPASNSQLKPYTLNPEPDTLSPEPQTLHPTPSTLHPEPESHLITGPKLLAESAQVVDTALRGLRPRGEGENGFDQVPGGVPGGQQYQHLGARAAF